MGDDRDERRVGSRHPALTVIGIDTETEKECAGMTRNVSATGLLFFTTSKLTVGQKLSVQIRTPLEGKEYRRVEASVVRVGPGEPESPFPYLAAIEFAEPIPEFENPTTTST